MRYLLDTDWVIHYLNGHPEIVPRVQELSAEGIGLSLAELYEGVLYSRNPQRSEEGLQAFLRGVELVVSTTRSRESLVANAAGSELRVKQLATSTF